MATRAHERGWKALILFLRFLPDALLLLLVIYIAIILTLHV